MLWTYDKYHRLWCLNMEKCEEMRQDEEGEVKAEEFEGKVIDKLKGTVLGSSSELYGKMQPICVPLKQHTMGNTLSLQSRS